MQSTPYGLGMDMSDRSLVVSLRQPDGTVAQSMTLPLTRDLLSLYLRSVKDLRPVVAFETGTHSNWVYDLVKELGFDRIIVADARMLKMIYQSDKKCDRVDSETLARFAQACPELLHATQPRGEQARRDRRLLSARHIAVQARTKVITHIRGLVKATGARLKSCDADDFVDLRDTVPADLVEVLDPVFEAIRKLDEAIGIYDELVEKRCKDDPVIAQLTQITGVGNITALAFVSCIENPARFKKNRTVGAFVGLCPRVDKSGEIERQLGITKRGDGYLRQLLVSSAQTILRKSSPATDLKRLGHKIATRGGKKAKRHAAVAVARKLAVLMLVLWKTGDKYEPLRNTQSAKSVAAQQEA